MVRKADFDVILIGAGPAGCVLANRLTENTNRRVLLLEAGPDYGPFEAGWPANLRDPTTIWPDSHAWGYVHARRPADQVLALPRARVVGGSSTINSCFWLRGSDADYDGWKALGNAGWSAADLLPYFRRAESDPVGGERHGTAGPVPVYRASASEQTGIDRAFIAAAQRIGLPLVADLNADGVQRPSVGPMPKNIRGGVRMSGAFTYLASARGRSALRVESNALVDRLILKGTVVSGVRLADGRTFEAPQVILCAGAYGTPAILMRSGIGPADHLAAVGVRVVIDLPGVGGNLLDHPFVRSRSITPWTIKPDHRPTAAAFNQVAIKARSQSHTSEIDLHVYQGQRFDPDRNDWVFWLSVTLQDAPSRGRLRLVSQDPAATLEIDHNYLSQPGELDALRNGVDLALRLVAEPPLANVLVAGSGFERRWLDRSTMDDWIRREVGTTFHPAGTCRMGPASDADAVVDNVGRVHGLSGVRVTDASILPTGPRANLHCTVVAVAEKLADAVRDDA